jgi:hypothetical protein
MAKLPAAELPMPTVVPLALGWMVRVPAGEPVKAAPMAKLSAVMVKLAELMTLNTFPEAVLRVVAVKTVLPLL